MSRSLVAVLIFAALLIAPIRTTIHAAPGALPAFPGAKGFGSTTPGGRGGNVRFVTNLNDSGAGSLREALEAKEPRMVLFKVGGTITLKDDIKIDEPFVTVAGQTAPGDGIQIKGAMIVVKTHDVVIRYIKVRSGDEVNLSDPADRDAICLCGGVAEVYNVVIDHSSLLWGPDMGGLAILLNVHDVTVQNSIMGEGPYLSRHPEATTAASGHSMAASMFQLDPAKYGSAYPRNITMHHNLLTSSDIRMPMVIGAENVDLVNNVIYNWGNKAASGNPRKLNLINNMFIPGPQTKVFQAWSPHLHSTTPTLFPASVYEQGNVTEGFSIVRGAPSSVYASSRFGVSSIGVEQSALAAYDTVLQTVGAKLPVQDREDTRILDNLVRRSGTFLNANQFIWPVLASGTAPLDTDQDGMPDSWEQANFGGISSTVASSGNDFDGDGYTDLEEYLNEKDAPQSTTPPTPDTVAPTVGITAPTNGSTVSGSTATLSAAASDNNGVVGVQFVLDGNNLGAEDTSLPYAITWNTTSTANGSHRLSAIARDSAGNRTQSPEVTVTVATTGPAPTTGNLLYNPSFEMLDAGGLPDGWSKATSFSRSASAFQTGAYAGMVKATNNGAYTSRQQVNNLKPGNYAFSGGVNIPPTADKFTFTLQVRWLDATGNGVRTDTIQSFTAATSGWQTVNKTLTAPAGTTQARLVMTAASLNATIYVDDFSLTGAP